ncbi:MAG: PAS domain S-box protein [Candidatus Auribacterota bacterium]|jgi:PAS domain S-box-containing protein|nr:PAS domain S-box protein [Candidatus Auribacterota bacterium]
MPIRKTREELEYELKQAREQIAQFEEQEKIRQRYERLFELRNTALRIFFECTMKIDNDGNIPAILCYSLHRICCAKFTAFARYYDDRRKLVLQTSYDGSKISSFTGEYLQELSSAQVESLSSKIVRPFNTPERHFTQLIPCDLRGDDLQENSYCLSMLIRGKLLGVVIVQLNQGKDLILKDIIESTLHYWGMALQRELDKQELMESKISLAHSEEEVRMIFENCGVPMCLIDKNFRIVKFNRHFTSLFEISTDDVASKHCYEILMSDKCEKKTCVLKQTEKQDCCLSAVHKMNVNGKTVFAHVISTPVIENGNLTGYIQAIHDISEQKQMEAQLQASYDELKEKNAKLEETQMRLLESSKMSAVGTLCAGIAHEFNNILTIICGYLDLCSHSRNMDDISVALQTISDVTKRAQAITDGLLHFAQADDSQHKSVINIQDVLKGTLVLVDKEFAKQGIKIITDIEDVPATYCYEHQLAQVFLSVISNARDAMIKTAARILTVSLHYKEDAVINSRTAPDNRQSRPHPRGCICVSFSDTGVGMSQEVKEKMFEPFFTTKGVLANGMESKSGTGLDMSTSYGIVKRHNGVFEVESELGKGTTVNIYLPVDSSGGLLYD